MLIQYFSGDKIEKLEIGGTCSASGGGEAYTGFWWGNLKERKYLGDPSVDGRIIINLIFRMWDVGLLTASRWFRIEQLAGRYL